MLTRDLPTIFRRLTAALAALVLLAGLMTGLAQAQSKVTIAIGGSACLCYLPTVLAEQLGE
jgi:NitT/TauT family transport system substrate-binding protein